VAKEATTLDLRTVDWPAVADLICSILAVARDNEEALAAQFPDLTPEQQRAMAISGAPQEKFEGGQFRLPGARKPQRKQKAIDGGWSDEDKEKLFWYLATAYLLDRVGLLDQDKAAKLATFEAEIGVTWQASVRRDLDVSDDFVKRVHTLCRKTRDEAQAVGFLLRGMGCPCAEEALRDFMPEIRS
jgi:hypothetical protein